jgi:uncharacterized membrane protein
MRTAAAVFIALAIVSVGLLVESSRQLPERVASHFNGAGEANDWMSRPVHLVFMGVFVLGLPLSMAALFFCTRYFSANAFNIPHRELWLAPENRARVDTMMFKRGLWFGSLLMVFANAIGLLVIDANQQPVPHLNNQLFGLALVLFLVALIVWCVGFVRFFGQTPDRSNALGAGPLAANQ